MVVPYALPSARGAGEASVCFCFRCATALQVTVTAGRQPSRRVGNLADRPIT